MSKQVLFWIFLISFLVVFSEDTEAGCNGSCETVNGEDWTVSLDTHMWDEEITVDNLNVNIGASLKLENVNISIKGQVNIYAKTEWISSNVTLLREEASNNVTIYDSLDISGSQINIYVNMNDTDTYSSTTTHGFYLGSVGELVIRDIDNDKNTNDDVSVIRPVQTGELLYGFGYATWEVKGENSNLQKFIIKNSLIIDIWTAQIYANNPIYTGNVVYGDRNLYFHGDNLTYSNNQHYAKELNSTRNNVGSPITLGNNSIFVNNTFHSGNDGIGIQGGSHSQIINNSFTNITSDAIWANTSPDNISISYNHFININTAVWAGNVSALYYFENTIYNNTSSYATYFSGSNIEIDMNSFAECATQCLLLTNLEYDDNENIFIRNNDFRNYSGNGISIGTGKTNHYNVTIEDNNFHNAPNGVNSGSWYANILPENVIIRQNIFVNITKSIKFESYGGNGVLGGDNYLIVNNTMRGGTHGISGLILGVTYDLLVIQNNLFDTDEYGIDLSCNLIDNSMEETKIVGNYFETQNIGISLTSCRGTTSLNSNYINTTNIGINLYGSQASVENNVIAGVCNSDTCSKVSFTKVAEIGINSDRFSETIIANNVLRNFYNSIKVTGSDSEIRSNTINFTNAGIHLENSNVDVVMNYVNNSYYGLMTSDSIIQISGTEMNTFDIGISSFNSSIDLDYVIMSQGRLCMYYVDTNYTILNYQNLNCSESILYEKYFLNVKIQTDKGMPSPQHSFQYANKLKETFINGYTDNSGNSDYFLVTTKKIDNAGLSTNFNPFTFNYLHNGIENQYITNIDSNFTVIAELDTTPPSTTLHANSTLINDNEIFLNFVQNSEKNDLRDYDVYVLTNDGINFAEWTLVGNYNDSIIRFVGENGFKYRFKSVSTDIFGNIEYKEGYDCEIEVDVQFPSSSFANINSDYYFANDKNVLLFLDSKDADIDNYEISVFYTNFTTAFLNPDAIVWTEIHREYHYDKVQINYLLTDQGHYGFSLLATDRAGNTEVKEVFDFIINYDPQSDTLSFEEIPERWGDEKLEINLKDSNFNLDFDLFFAMESVNYENPFFTWYEHPSGINNEIIIINGLLDKTRYYLYAQSTDLAGNIENPLNTTEYFSSSGEYNQLFDLKYIPLSKKGYPFKVSIDNNLDGAYELQLNQGNNRDDLGDNEFFIDGENKTLVFGGMTNGGFVPNEGLSGIKNIKIEYSGVHAIFEVYTGNPDSAGNLEIMPTNVTHIVFEYDIPLDASKCYVQRTTNISKGWFNQELLSPCYSGLYQYEHTNPDTTKKYYYRILIEDEFGHTSISENRSIDMKDVVKLYSTNEKTETGFLGMDSIIPITALVGIIMLSFGGILLYRTKTNEILDENVNVIDSKPVAKYKVEELYLIYKDGRLIRNISAVEVKTDSEIMSGMLTAINDFVQDSFNTEGDLGDIGYGNNKIVLQRGNNSYLAAVIYGEVDNYFKGKMINAVRTIENKNPTMNSWNGDSASIGNVKVSLKPIIDETYSVTRQMVDNYFTEKDLAITTVSEKMGDIITLKVNISNYSSTIIQNCRIKPEINSSILSIIGIEPDLAYHFNENSFNLGDIESYNEVYLEIKLRLKSSEPTAAEIKMYYEMKNKEGDLSSVTQING